jgi:hypothetical protein
VFCSAALEEGFNNTHCCLLKRLGTSAPDREVSYKAEPVLELVHFQQPYRSAEATLHLQAMWGN